MVSAVSCRVKQLAFELILCGFSVRLFQLPVIASQSVVLTWKPSSDPYVAGYRIYSGIASRDYDSMVTIGTTNATTVSGLVDGATYYFAATAVDNQGNESDFSDEAVYTTSSTSATLTILPNATGGFCFNVSGVSGSKYIVQCSTNLMDWVSVRTNTAPFSFMDTNTANLPQCFYRAYYLQP